MSFNRENSRLYQTYFVDNNFYTTKNVSLREKAGKLFLVHLLRNRQLVCPSMIFPFSWGSCGQRSGTIFLWWLNTTLPQKYFCISANFCVLVAGWRVFITSQLSTEPFKLYRPSFNGFFVGGGVVFDVMSGGKSLLYDPSSSHTWLAGYGRRKWRKGRKHYVNVGVSIVRGLRTDRKKLQFA